MQNKRTEGYYILHVVKQIVNIVKYEMEEVIKWWQLYDMNTYHNSIQNVEIAKLMDKARTKRKKFSGYPATWQTISISSSLLLHWF